MLGYTGWFSAVYTGDNKSAGNYDLFPTCIVIGDDGAEPLEAVEIYHPGTRIVWEVEVLRNTGAATIVPVWGGGFAPGIGGSYTAVAPYDGGLTAPLPLGDLRKYVENIQSADDTGSSGFGIGARLAVTSAGYFSYRLKVRPYHMSGWVNANLTGATALTTIEPGIVNSPMGRASAASAYSDEISMAKDEIGRRLTAAGIDLDKIPTDGVASLVANYGQPQAIATYLIPELCDPATYLALSIIHERFATRGDDWDAYKSVTYRERYENAFQLALKALPLNIDGDYQLESDEQQYGSPKSLSL